jgi:hypothetical protein
MLEFTKILLLLAQYKKCNKIIRLRGIRQPLAFTLLFGKITTKSDQLASGAWPLLAQSSNVPIVQFRNVPF